MKTFIIVKSLFISVALVATATYAVIREDSSSGVVRTFEEGPENINLTGHWDDVVEESPVSESFWYNTDIEAVNAAEFSSSLYQPYVDGSEEWIGSAFTIDENAGHPSDAPLADRSATATKSEGVWLRNMQPEIDRSTAEFFYLFDNPSSRDSTVSRSAGKSLGVSSGVTPLLDSLDLAQTLEWYEVGDPASSAQDPLQTGTATDEELSASSAWVDLNEFDLDIKDVPGPSPLLLLGIGLVALILRLGHAKIS